MSIEQLKEDLRANVATLAVVDTAPALVGHLKNSLWPFLETVLEELTEMDEAMQEMVEDAPEILHTESAQVFAGLITGGEHLVTELLHRAGNDNRLIALVKEWRSLATQGKAILEEVTIPDDEDPDDEADDAEGKPQ